MDTRTQATRMERDIVGELAVPADAYYGVHTLRAMQNFPITGQPLQPEMIRALAQIKKACAVAAGERGALDASVAQAIADACDDVLTGSLNDQFPVDPVQGGAGTSVNMNMNEVLANRAIERLGGRKGDYALVHPNDHVNYGQSTNDVYPSCGKLTAIRLMAPLLDALQALVDALAERAAAFDGVVKMGRTQLQDAVPIRLGQEFAAYAAVLRRDVARLRTARDGLRTLTLGGTAVGPGLNADPAFAGRALALLCEYSGEPLRRSEDLIDGTQNLDACVQLSAALKTCAVNLSKISNDLRLMASGPSAGLGEINLPARQNGSSIMPGKINPVIPEVVNQIAFGVIGNDLTVTLAAEAGQLELNAFEPILFYKLYESIQTLTHGMRTLTVNCIRGITANAERCRRQVEEGAGMAAALCPYIGYTRASSLAREAVRSHTPLRALAQREAVLPEARLEALLDPYALTTAQR